MAKNYKREITEIKVSDIAHEVASLHDWGHKVSSVTRCGNKKVASAEARVLPTDVELDLSATNADIRTRKRALKAILSTRISDVCTPKSRMRATEKQGERVLAQSDDLEAPKSAEYKIRYFYESQGGETLSFDGPNMTKVKLENVLNEQTQSLRSCKAWQLIDCIDGAEVHPHAWKWAVPYSLRTYLNRMYLTSNPKFTSSNSRAIVLPSQQKFSVRARMVAQLDDLLGPAAL